MTDALIDSVIVPIWLTLSRRPLQAFFSIALLTTQEPISALHGNSEPAETHVLILKGLVTVKSSPTIWIGVVSVTWLHASQSS